MINFLLIVIPSSVPSPAVHRFIALFSIPESSATGSVAIETAAAAVPHRRYLLTRKLKENKHIIANFFYYIWRKQMISECLSRIRVFFHPGTNFFHPGSRIRIKEFEYFNLVSKLSEI
jgi:hypothetical protein